MRSGHTAKDCPSTKKCKLCSKPHNTLLHTNQNNVTTLNVNDHTKESASCTQVATATNSRYQVLLQTAIVHVLNKQGELVPCRALLDSGSQINLSTNACRARLGITLESSDSSFTVARTGQISPTAKFKFTSRSQ